MGQRWTGREGRREADAADDAMDHRSQRYRKVGDSESALDLAKEVTVDFSGSIRPQLKRRICSPRQRRVTLRL